MLGNLYIAMGKVRLIFIYNVISLLFIFSFLLLLFDENLADFALVRGLLGLLSVVCWMFLALYFTGSRMLSFAATIMLPAVALSLASVYLTIRFVPQIESVYLSLIANLSTFGSIYLLLLGLAYLLVMHRVSEWSQLRKLLADYLLKAIRR